MERLPTELLYYIGHYSREESYSSRNLWALSLCSRRFHDVFNTLLYSEIRIDHDGDRIPLHDVNLIIRLWHNAQLARRVHRLHIRWQECGRSESSESEEEPQTVAFIDTALDEIFGSDASLDRTRDEWKHHLLARCPEAWAGVLLVRLSHLRRLVVGYEQSDLLADILRKAAQRQQPFHRTPPFPHLVEVNAYAQGRLYWIDSDILTSFFYFPAVRRVNAFAVAETSAAPGSLAVHHESRPVQSIAIANVIYCRGMLDWLAASVGLEHVALKIAVHPADNYWNLPPTRRFHAPRFRQALLPFAETLRLLCLEAACSYKLVWWDNDRDQDEAAFGSFREFVNLRKLIVRCPFLLPQSSTNDETPLPDILPASLESLGITDIEDFDYPNLVAEVLRLVRHGPNLFARLNQIQLYVIHIDEDALAGLRTECESAGIDLKVEKQQEEPWEYHLVSAMAALPIDTDVYIPVV
ncbi:hypothetical protein BP00DRAFT_442893 [Aspergillus indologenus CBS 114.80]|uniref:Leucine-rich repeat domain-containing protein n=1 Tax=Aspergillus indologenus CBS 114.80 TaxID=1450541 RepID=A0A2V5IM83_9EURO|nr:hypothetical protein BP00DRAFT_442893 [Aspergillus indologenus CBS 114.80]